MGNQVIVDGIIFLVLFIVSVAMRQRFTTRGYSATAAGGIVMSTGIFSAFALRALPFYNDTLGRIATLEVVVLWLLITWSIVCSIRAKGFHIHLEPLLQRFAIGTWVAGTAVLAVLSARSLPEVWWLSDVLAAISVVLYIPYVVLFVGGYISLWARVNTQRSTGVILLATVSTQSVIIALYTVLGAELPHRIIEGMVALDILFLGGGILLIWLHYLRVKFYDLADRWHNTNCIIHGAVSITGLALTITSAVDTEALLTVWYTAAGLFALVECIELIRLAQRVGRYGWGKGAFSYDVSQWSRNFTFGMLLAFSMVLAQRMGTPLLQTVVHNGVYVVATLLVVEVVIFARSRFSSQG